MARRPARRVRDAVAVALVAGVVAGVAGCAGSGDGATPRPTTTSSPTSSPTSSSTTTTRPPLPPSSVPGPAGARVTQPLQPVAGPGSSDLAHRDWRVSSGGTGADAWYVFEPVSPRPRTAPVAVVMHGYYEFSGYDSVHELIRHTVLDGSIVVYPVWQTDVAVPCPGPFDIEPCMRSAVAGVRGALAHLRAEPDRVQPDLDRVSWFGLSFGGILTVNLANRWRQLDLPEPRAIFLDDPHDSGLDGLGEPSLDDSLTGIPSSVLLECHVGAEGLLVEDPGGGCNALFPKLGHIPPSNKAIIATRPDAHGEPALSSVHGVCASRPGEADAYDWNVCWKVWDALRDAAHRGDRPRHALGDTPEHRATGTWSDGRPIVPLLVEQTAPIRP